MINHNMDNDRGRSGSFFSGVVLGAVIGAGLTFLLGTPKGKEVRKKIRDQYPDFFEKVDDVLEDLGDKYGDVVDQVKELEEQVAEKSADTKTVVKEKVASLGKAVEHLGKKLESVSSSKRRFLKGGKKL